MAVYFAHRFAQIYHIEVSEDEIAFIAFHIGSYLENNKQSREHATLSLIHIWRKELLHWIWKGVIVMTRILLACGIGASTGFMAANMRKAAKAQGCLLYTSRCV